MCWSLRLVWTDTLINAKEEVDERCGGAAALPVRGRRAQEPRERARSARVRRQKIEAERCGGIDRRGRQNTMLPTIATTTTMNSASSASSTRSTDESVRAMEESRLDRRSAPVQAQRRFVAIFLHRYFFVGIV